MEESLVHATTLPFKTLESSPSPSGRGREGREKEAGYQEQSHRPNPSATTKGLSRPSRWPAVMFFQLALGVNEFLAEAKNSGFVIYKLLVYGMTGTNSNGVGSLAKNKHSIL